MTEANDSQQPVFITAPTARNGVTLLQRLLNSTRQIIIYGENVHFCEALPKMVSDLFQMHQSSGAQMAETRRRFLNETTEFWSSGLWPDTQAYVEVAVQTLRAFAGLYQDCSKQYGFERWGIKHPCRTFANFERVFRMLPQLRYVYIYRNLYDVAKSSKARKFVRQPEDHAQLAAVWRDSVQGALNMQAPNLLIIKYEEFVAAPDTWLPRLESFTGVSGIDRSVMQRKVNTFRGDPSRGLSPNEYIPPDELTGEEMAALQAQAGELLAELGYEPATAAANS